MAKEYGISPFDVLNSDIDDFARLVNYLVESGRGEQTKKKTEKRIRVNDSTATGGWW